MENGMGREEMVGMVEVVVVVALLLLLTSEKGNLRTHETKTRKENQI